ncbi:hypothetical protein GCM10027160_46440 [Streptomyces calidiresistens]
MDPVAPMDPVGTGRRGHGGSGRSDVPRGGFPGFPGVDGTPGARRASHPPCAETREINENPRKTPARQGFPGFPAVLVPVNEQGPTGPGPGGRLDPADGLASRKIRRSAAAPASLSGEEP